jgi:F420H(2)-dependent quinone reductase
MSRGFFLTNRVANPVLRRLLRTPLGRVLGRSLAVVRYPGRRTGAPHELVCSYVRDGDTAWVLVGQAERKTWWRNLRSRAPVELWLAGRHLRATAVAVVGREEPEECARGLAAYSARMPRVARLPPSDVVMVRADITGS